jgi:hypothetical protein
MSTLPNVRDLLEGHITLELDSIDRLYLNGYVPQLQHGPGLVGFLCQHRGQPIASPAYWGRSPENSWLKLKASPRGKPSLCFTLSTRNPKTCVPIKCAEKRPVHDAVVFIGVAQEKAGDGVDARSVGLRLSDRRISQPGFATTNSRLNTTNG